MEGRSGGGAGELDHPFHHVVEVGADPARVELVAFRALAVRGGGQGFLAGPGVADAEQGPSAGGGVPAEAAVGPERSAEIDHGVERDAGRRRDCCLGRGAAGAFPADVVEPDQALHVEVLDRGLGGDGGLPDGEQGDVAIEAAFGGRLGQATGEASSAGDAGGSVDDLLRGEFGSDPRAAVAGVAGAVVAHRLQPEALGFADLPGEEFLPIGVEIAVRTGGDAGLGDVEHRHAAEPGALHGLELAGDACLVDIAMQPVAPDPGPAVVRWLGEVAGERVGGSVGEGREGGERKGGADERAKHGTLGKPGGLAGRAARLARHPPVPVIRAWRWSGAG